MNHIGWAIWWPKSTGTGGIWRFELDRAIRDVMDYDTRDRVHEGIGYPIVWLPTVIAEQNPYQTFHPKHRHPHNDTIVTPTMTPTQRRIVMRRVFLNCRDSLRNGLLGELSRNNQELWNVLGRDIVLTVLQARFAQNHREHHVEN
jgi:hypothetical protein